MKMMMKNLLLPLGIPLLVAVVAIVGAFLYFHLDWSCDDFTTNLLTEVIGIAFTVGYVEWVVYRYRARQWEKAEQGIMLRLRSSVVSWIIQIRVSLGYPGFPDMAILSAQDYSTEYPEFKRLAEDLKPRVQQLLRTFNPQRWTSFVDALQGIRRESETLVMLFEDKLTAGQYGALLDAQSSVSKALVWCPVFLNSIKQSQPNNSSLTEEMLREGIAPAVTELLDAVIRLGDALPEPHSRVPIPIETLWKWYRGD